MEKLNPRRSQTSKEPPLAFRSMFLHAWDLAHDGVDKVMGWMSDAGLNTMCLAGNYHSGWFIHPHNSKHRAFMTEGSVCYFHPQPSLYKGLRLQPHVASLCKKRDWFAAAGKRLERHNLRLVSWTIGTHNSRLGQAHPELTQRNVYGDRLPHALCPANDEVVAYLQAFCRDLAFNHPLWALQLECFGWMNIRHGHHHERDLVELSNFEAELLSLCFCRACARKARTADVDIERVRAKVKAILDAAFREAPQRPRGHPRSMLELETKLPELKRFNEWRRQYAASIIAGIRGESLRGTDCRLLLETGFDSELADVVDGFACAAYRQNPAETLQSCRNANRAAPRDWHGLMQCLVQLGLGVPQNEKQLRGIVQAVSEGGCNGINFYNRSEAPPKMLGWVATVMKEFSR
jgi:hypothetical protein